jgi:hypothetical protein
LTGIRLFFDRAKVVKAFAEQGGEAVKLGSGELPEGATREFLFNGSEAHGTANHFFFREQAGLERLQFDGPRGAEL